MKITGAWFIFWVLQKKRMTYWSSLDFLGLKYIFYCKAQFEIPWRSLFNLLVDWVTSQLTAKSDVSSAKTLVDDDNHKYNH